MYKYKNDPTDDFETVFDSNDLFECLEHFEQTDNIEPLAVAIANQRRRINELKDYAEQTENNYLLNKLRQL